MASEASGPRADTSLDTPRRALAVAAMTTGLVTLLSHSERVSAALEPYVGTLVGAAFLLVTWHVVLRHDTARIRAHGLSLGGLTEPGPLTARRLSRAAVRAIVWATLVAAVVFPPFWFGYRIYWGVEGPFEFRLPDGWWDLALGQLLVVALPEEAFYRGYLQTALERGWARRRWRILGAQLGVGCLATSTVFALGHFLALPHPNRLAVFFPALVFGWLRERTGGIGAPLVFHAMCNLLVDTLAVGYSP
jgi:hypothetical protein